MPAADYATVATQIISLLTAQAVTTAYPTSATDIGDDRRNVGELKEAVIESDIEARVAICETPGNGFRPSFIGSPTTLTPLSGNAQAAELPERIGPVSRVEIKIAAADSAWIAGEQCPLSEIQEILANPDSVFQNTAHNASNSGTGGFYFIDEMSDFITWTGDSVRVYTAQLGTVDRATPTLLTPDAYTPFLVARSLARLYKHGDSPAFMEWYDRQAMQLMMLIRKGERALPQVEPLLRSAA